VTSKSLRYFHIERQPKVSKSIVIPDEVVISKIFMIRGHRVMIDRDLASLYGVETRALKQAVRRNIERFPEDFMFEMNKKEFNQWREENITVSEDKDGTDAENRI